jgi:type VI secretion system lysozyme-like protein
MTTSRPAPAAPALLFDRLANLDRAASHEPVPLRALDRDGLLQSVIYEIDSLLNTRCSFTDAQLQARGRTTLEYGVPAATPAYPGASSSRDEVAARMQAAIAAYEPRLRQPRVAVHPVDGRPLELRAHVDGLLAVGTAPVPVAFTLHVGAPRPRTP